MKFDIRKQFVVLKIIEKKNFNLYTLIDFENGEKVVALGVTNEQVKERDLVNVVLNLKIQTEKFIATEGVKYFQTVNIFVPKIDVVNV